MKSTLEKAQIMREAAEAVPPFSNLEVWFEDKWCDWAYQDRIEPNWNWDKGDYRIKTDPIAKGHNPDKLTVRQVGDGWRLLAKEEINVKRNPFKCVCGIEIYFCGLWRDNCSASDYNYTYRTQQPPGYFLPKEKQIAEGHNPDKLTVKQVGDGWRLLAEEEIADRELTTDIERWNRYSQVWENYAPLVGNQRATTYRTQKPPGYFLPNHEPKKGVVKIWRYFVRDRGGSVVCMYQTSSDKWGGFGEVIARQPIEYPYTEGEGL